MSNIGIVISYHEEKILLSIKHIRKYTNSYIVIVDDSENRTEVIIK